MPVVSNRTPIKKSDPEQTAESFGLRHFTEAGERGLTVSQLLEREDPTVDRPEAERHMDAFERVLKAAKIRTNPVPEMGIEASTYEDITSTPNRRGLTVELMSRIWRQANGRSPITSAVAAPWMSRHAALSGQGYGTMIRTGPSTMAVNGERAILLSGDVGTGSLANPWYDNPELRAKRLVPPVPLDALVARTTAIDTDAYRTIYVTDDLGQDAYRMKRVVEGAEIPTTTLVTAEHTIRIHKFGRALRATYEQLRRQRVDRIAFIVARMALQAEVDKVSLAVSVLTNGDGNANTSALVVTNSAGSNPVDPVASGGAANVLRLQGWTRFKLRFSLTYAPDIVLAQEAGLMQLLTLPVGQGTGVIPLALMPNNAFGVVSPINDQMAGGIRYGLSLDVAAATLLAFQSDLALERVMEIGGNVSEVERYINNQTQMLTLTEVEGFGIIDPNSVRILSINS